ncbi:MAG TPA: TIGR01777 family oxidoreductase [Terracidiphilus sp.]|nr:TIGR01777 family oxidoreductase [Terracidiphilus sp.]
MPAERSVRHAGNRAAQRSACAGCARAPIGSTRSHGSGERRWNPSAEPAIADTAALRNCAAAIHLSGANLSARRWTREYRRELVASRVDSTRALAAMLARMSNPPTALLVASAVGIYGDRGDELLDESSPAGSGFLADLCRQWEAAAQPAVDAGIRVAHLRLGVVLGPGKGALDKMLPFFRMGIGGRLGSGRQWMSWISLADAIDAILFILDHALLSGPLNLVAPHPITNSEFTRTLAHQLRRPAVLPAPALALRLALGSMADQALLASIRVQPSRLLAAGFRFTDDTVDKALAFALT